MENYTDITKTGTEGLKGLKGLNNQSSNPSMDEIIEADKLRRSTTKSSPESVNRLFQADAVENIGSKLAELNYGKSIYDKALVESLIASPEAFLDYRAEEQPWYAQVGAGIAKGAILAGTTFLDGTLGLLFGGGTAIAEGRWSGLWDNDFSKAMLSINEVAEKELPNYYSQQEQNEPWYENIFTANFLGDKLIKNMGFTVGAFYSGNVAASALKATKLPQLIGGIMGERALDAAKTYRATRTAEDLQKYMTLANRASQAPANITSSVGALISSVNEGRVEALHNSKDWFEANKLKLEDSFKSRLENIKNEYNANKGSFVRMGENSLVDPAYLKYQESMENEKRMYDQALGKLSEDRLKMGNVDLLMNLPILMASNLFQFGRLYANGFKTARKASNIVNKGKYAETSLEGAIETGKKAGLAIEDVAKDFAQYGTKATKAGAVWNATKSALSESSEEALQSLASNVSGNYYADDVNNFYRSKIDPEATEETISWSKAFALGLNETVNDGSTWEGAFIGGLTGAMGMPRFRGVRDSEGKLRTPVTMEGGMIGEFKDYNEKMVREQSIADYMNNRMLSPEFLNYYKGLVRHNKYQNDMNMSVENNDPFEFKNAEHALLISDIAMFDNAGKLEDLNILINSAFDTSDENLKSIVDNTTTLTETNKSVGPYIDSNGNPLYSTEEGKQEMIKKITESKDEMVKKINDYIKIKNDIDIKTGQQLNDDLLEELTWIRGLIDDWNERSDKIVDEIKPALSSLVSELSSQKDFFGNLALKEGSAHTSVTPLYEAYTKTLRESAESLRSIESLIHLPLKHVAALIAGNKDFADNLKEAISNTSDITADLVLDYIKKIDDIVKLNNAAGTYNSKLKEYLENPSKLIKDHAKVNNETIANENEKKTNNIKLLLNSALNLSLFREVLNNEDDQVIKESILETMESEDNEMAKNYRETTLYYNEIKKVINSIDEDPQIKLDALKLINELFNNSENLQQLANLNSIYINNENAFDEDSEGDVEISSARFLNALYAILNAMSKVNNDNIFKDRFSAEYKKPITKIDNAKGDDRSTTGSSGTSTVPPVNNNVIIPEIPSPIGNITKDMVAAENKNINEQSENPQQLDNKQSGKRPYYRPSIPELHIEATKEGDFREFSDVVAEREKGKDFSGIYNYLKNAGVFEYVNNGNLNVGDELKFMIDPEFENQVANQPWHTQPTIFIVDGKTNQIVGSLDESEYSVSKYEGLESLQKRIKDEYANRKDVALKGLNTSLTAFDIEAKKADIERRRNESLNKKTSFKNTNHKQTNRYSINIASKFGFDGFDVDVSSRNNNSTTGFIYNKALSQHFDTIEEAKLYASEIASRDKEYIAEINAKYDAELANLEQSTTTTIKAKKADIERRRQEELNKNSGTSNIINLPTQNEQEARNKAEKILKENKELVEQLEKEFKNKDATLFNELEEKLEKLLFNETKGEADFAFDEEGKLVLDLNKVGKGDRINSNYTRSREGQIGEFEVGDKVQVNNGSVRIFSTVTKVSSTGRIIEAQDEDGIVTIRNGVVLSSTTIQKEKEINAKYDAELAALETTTPEQQAKQKFIATPTTRVSQIMVGKIPYGTEEKSLKDISNVKTEGENASVFGIVKNGVLSTNGLIDDNKIIKPMDMSQKEGRMYLLIPNARGMYSPAAVRVKHFNNVEFNLDDVNVASTTMAKNIQSGITKLAESTNPEDLSEAMKLVNRDLYTGTLHIDWFNSSNGSGIRFTKVEKDAMGNEIYEGTTPDGKPKRKEVVKLVYLTEKWDPNTLYSITGEDEVQTGPNIKDTAEIIKEITSILQDFNLPIQINLGMLNKTGYNKMIINSNILTSNIIDASVKSSWFTTDYFDNEGNLHKAVSPASIAPQPIRKIETPVGGKESVVHGTKIVLISSNKEYFVDLKTNTIKDSNDNIVEVNNENKILFDLAWAQDNFGDSTNGSMLVDNKVLLPSGKVIDRNTQKYIEGEEALNVKDIISGRVKEKENKISNSKKVIEEIYENLKRVDKEQTDSDFYYILEDDGLYHKYSRVHSRLGGNSIESPKLTQEIDNIRTELSKNTDNIKQYDNYLTALENIYKIKLDAYKGKTDIKSRNAIINVIKDARLGTESQKAINAGTTVDNIIRLYFTLRDISKITRPPNITESAFIDLITTLNKIRSNMEARGERFLADNIVLFNKHSDGTRVAGEVDILSVDQNGNFRIYDVKTSKYSFYDFVNKYGQDTNYFENKSSWQRMSQKDYYTLQLSAYKNLFESQYGVPIKTLAIMPFVITYEKSNVTKITNEKGILINYNPAVNVPLTSNVLTVESLATPVSTTQKQEGLPIFESSLELLNPVNDLIPEASFEFPDVTTGYYELDGKIHHGYITPITTIDGVNVYMMKIPNITKGFGRIDEEAHVASNNYYAVFPNGLTVKVLSNASTDTDTSAKEKIISALKANPSRVKEESSKKTLLFDPNITPVSTSKKEDNSPTTIETPSNILNNKSSAGANITILKEQAIKNHDEEFEDEFTLRKIDETTETPVWNLEKELKWLDKVLPQLSKNDRVKVVKGLIKVGEKGVLAWGLFDKGIITLSDIAAEGTAYHEAFHVVFNLMLSDLERLNLYAEARILYGNKSNIELEEAMAEGFRKYVMDRDSRTLGRKILDFFKNLLIKTTNWKHVTPHLTVYYRMINEGKYANRTDSISSIKDLRSEDNIKYRVSPNTQVKPGVPELFETNPELANAVYEALGFKQYDVNSFGIPSKFFHGKDISLYKFMRSYDEGVIDSDKNKGNKFSGIISDLLRTIVTENTNIKIQSVKFNNSEDKKKYFGNNDAFYHNGFIFYDIDAHKSSNEKVDIINHEIIHALTNNQYVKNKEFRDKIDYLYNYTLKNIIYEKDGGEYGFKNQFEFIAESISNPYFANILSKIESPYKNSNSLFDEIISAIKEAFLLINAFWNSNQNEKSVLDDMLYSIVEYSSDIGRQITPQQKQQAQQLYSQYLDTIFPDSKVEDIVYHNTMAEFDEFISPDYKESNGLYGTDEGIYFSKKINYYGIKDGKDIPAILNLKNPEKYRHETFMSAMDASGIRKDFFTKKGYDGFVTIDYFAPEFYGDEGQDELVFAVAIKPEQIHILGSKQDVKEFKEFVSNTKFRKDVNNNREVNNLNFNTLDSETLKALKDKKWTEEMWNSVSQIEREQAIKCISF